MAGPPVAHSNVNIQYGVHSSELLCKPFQAAWDTSIAYSADMLRFKLASVLCKEVPLTLRMHYDKTACWGRGACLETACQALAHHCNNPSPKLGFTSVSSAKSLLSGAMLAWRQLARRSRSAMMRSISGSTCWRASSSLCFWSALRARSA